MKVLIVDDSASMRKIIRRVLMLSGYNAACLEAANGIEALEVLQREKVDLVLTDINMPQMNGEELIERLTQDELMSSIPVLVVSTDRSEDRLSRMLQRGCRGYVTKPFTPEALAQSMKQVLSEATDVIRSL